MREKSVEEEARKRIHAEITYYYSHQMKDRRKFVPGQTKIQSSGAVFDEKEINAMVNAILDGWFGLGKYARKFELDFSEFLGAKETILVNSGSSANLLALTALLASKKIEPGSEVITPAVTFPTTLNPIIQNNLTPVFIDIKLETYNLDLERLRDALSDKTRVLILPHTLGIPNEMDVVMDFAQRNNLYVIEDSCDALGSTYEGKYTGTFGVFGTFSFYPAHHITLGEGGAVVTNDPHLVPVVRSLRDWGRACVCPVCKVALDPDYNCPQRFTFETDTLPEDYDKRFIYQHIGYNLKPVEFQAAMGIEQLNKLPKFIKTRKWNYEILRNAFKKYSEHLLLPEVPPRADPCWFSFPITIRDGAPFTRQELVSWLEEHNIETRLLFAGNIIKQPAYAGMNYRLAGSLDNSDKVMRDSFFIGVYPGINQQQIEYIINTLDEFMRKR